MSADTARRFGVQLAQLDQAFSDFSHPGEQQLLLWDTQRADQLQRLLVHVDDAVVRKEVESVLDYFRLKVRPDNSADPGIVIVSLTPSCAVAGSMLTVISW